MITLKEAKFLSIFFVTTVTLWHIFATALFHDVAWLWQLPTILSAWVIGVWGGAAEVMDRR